jgi:hypothetical protein
MAKTGVTRRLDRIEKLLNVDNKEKGQVVILSTPYQPGIEPEIPEPVEEWITYKQELELAENRGYVCTIFLTDRIREYEGRNDLPEGLISMHDLKGKIPFTELLDQAKRAYARNPKMKLRKYCAARIVDDD